MVIFDLAKRIHTPNALELFELGAIPLTILFDNYDKQINICDAVAMNFDFFCTENTMMNFIDFNDFIRWQED